MLCLESLFHISSESCLKPKTDKIQKLPKTGIKKGTGRKGLGAGECVAFITASLAHIKTGKKLNYIFKEEWADEWSPIHILVFFSSILFGSSSQLYPSLMPVTLFVIDWM